MADEVLLKGLIQKHLDATGSEVARDILANWTDCRERFVKVFPNEYRRALKEIAAGQLKEAA
jgi:glutamate synthase (NADPH/NADH) large chain